MRVPTVFQRHMEELSMAGSSWNSSLFIHLYIFVCVMNYLCNCLILGETHTNTCCLGKAICYVPSFGESLCIWVCIVFKCKQKVIRSVTTNVLPSQQKISQETSGGNNRGGWWHYTPVVLMRLAAPTSVISTNRVFSFTFLSNRKMNMKKESTQGLN